MLLLSVIPPRGSSLSLGCRGNSVKRSAVAIGLLSAALLVSNAWWVYSAVDVAHAYTDQQSSLRLSDEALSQALAIIKVAADPNTTRDKIVAEATRSARDASEPFEKEGFLWIGSLGLRFSESGRLLEATPSWSYEP